MMQLMAECYDIVKTALGMNNNDIADLFDKWNKGDLSSYLLEISATILRKTETESGKGFLLDSILDKTGMKGTGRVSKWYSLSVFAFFILHSNLCVLSSIVDRTRRGWKGRCAANRFRGFGFSYSKQCERGARSCFKAIRSSDDFSREPRASY